MQKPCSTVTHLHEPVADAVGVLLVLAAHAVFEQLLTLYINVALPDDGLVDAVVGARPLQTAAASTALVSNQPNPRILLPGFYVAHTLLSCSVA